MNNWNIPHWLEMEVRRRDLHCIYCGIKFDKKIKKHSATREHIVNDAKIINRENIALYCCSCNASKNAKQLSNRLTSDYCKKIILPSKRLRPSHNRLGSIHQSEKSNIWWAYGTKSIKLRTN